MIYVCDKRMHLNRYEHLWLLLYRYDIFYRHIKTLFSIIDTCMYIHEKYQFRYLKAKGYKLVYKNKNNIVNNQNSIN